MIPLPPAVILTAAEMRAAEQAAIDTGTSAAMLMARAGAGIAEQVRRLAAGSEVLVLAGPGNNGGDGYVAAAMLAAAGVRVRLAASTPPTTADAGDAAARWTGPVENVADAAPAPVLVDSLFGTGLARPLAPELAGRLLMLGEAARIAIAVDLPSGVASDTGQLLSPVPAFALTLALGAAKPSHLLQPAARWCGAVRVIDIGLDVASNLAALDRPLLPTPGPQAHKYSRGMVAIVEGAMPGAAALAAEAALRSGAGYALLLGGGSGGPAAVVRHPWSETALADPRIGAVLIGPGLGRDDFARAALDTALQSPHPLVIDGDALHLLGRKLDALADRRAPAILTPHAGEFDALFGADGGDKLSRARAAARRSGATMVFKGADTVIAAPDGRARLGAAASPWLSTAGTGDVLAGAIAALLAAGLDPLEAAGAGVWLHGAAARRLGASFVADDLARAMSAARAAW